MKDSKQKHPKGLMILFFTEMWERFGYYLMLGIFSLYMIEPTAAKFPGLGFTNAHAATYTVLILLWFI